MLGAARVVIVALGATSVVAAAYALAPGAAAAVCRSRGWIVFGVLLAAVAVWVALWLGKAAAVGPGAAILASPTQLGRLPLLSLLAMLVAAAPKGWC